MPQPPDKQIVTDRRKGSPYLREREGKKQKQTKTCQPTELGVEGTQDLLTAGCRTAYYTKEMSCLSF